MLFSGDWGKMIHEKNLKQKISWHCLFKLNILLPVGKYILTGWKYILTGWWRQKAWTITGHQEESLNPANVCGFMVTQGHAPYYCTVQI